MPNLGFRALYVYKDFNRNIVTVNVKRPASAYNIPLTRRDPGADGVLDTSDDGGKVTIYDYDAAYRGSAFVANQRQNSPTTDWARRSNSPSQSEAVHGGSEWARFG